MSCAVALSLAACGGGPTKTSVTPATQSGAQGSNRYTRSGCTPDSYGYCLLLTHIAGSNKVCFPSWHFAVMQYYYELYYNNVDSGQYVKTSTDYSCDGSDPAISWSPDDPADATGDPNLP